MNVQKAKKHHFVPECYLKNFITDKVLYTLDVGKVQKGYKAEPEPRQSAMICYYEDFYKIEDYFADKQFNLHEYDNLFVETEVLRKLEGKYKGLYQKVISSHRLSFAEAVSLSDFIIQMKIRNPYWLEHTLKKHKDEWIDSSMKNIFDRSFSKEGRFARIPEEVQRLVYDYVRDSSKTDGNYAKKIQLFGLIQRYSEKDDRNEIFRKAIIKSKWFLLVSPIQEPYFITTDNPGFSVSQHDNLIYNTRFTSGFAFHFPLSPHFCLLITDIEVDENSYEEKQDKYVWKVNVSGNDVVEVNDRSIQILNKLLIASSDWYLREIAKVNKPNNT